MNASTATIEMPDGIQQHPIVSHEEWLNARVTLLRKEKELTQLRDELCAARRALPWERVEKDYQFHSPEGTVSLADLFGERTQLFIQHFMLGPGWDEGCPGCSFLADHVDSARQHFEQADLSYAAVSRAPWEEIAPFKERMGWNFTWVSSHGSDFNFDYNVSFTPAQLAAGKAIYNYQETDPGIDELHGNSVFYKDPDGTIYHTYSSYSRGAEDLLAAFMFLDRVPKGRNETSVMSWMKHHDRYDVSQTDNRCCGTA